VKIAIYGRVIARPIFGAVFSELRAGRIIDAEIRTVYSIF
jgi:chromosome condensin MukBEF MukE localization factor